MKQILLVIAILLNLYAISAQASTDSVLSNSPTLLSISSCLKSSARIDLDSQTIEKGLRCDDLIESAIHRGVPTFIVDIVVAKVLKEKAIKDVELCALDILEIGNIITCEEEIEKARLLEITDDQLRGALQELFPLIEESI